MSAEREQLEAVEREFGLDSANSFIEIDERVEKLASSLIEARAERDTVAYAYDKAKEEMHTLRTQLAAARGELVAALATMQKIGAQKNAWIKRAIDAEKRILSLLTAALSEAP